MNKKEELVNFATENIKSRKWKAGQKIFSESQFMDIFHVSRFTARGAITELEKKGLVETQKGKGSFVKETDINRTEKEYIVIITEESTLSGNTKSNSRYMLDILQEAVLNRGYTPVVKIYPSANKGESLSIDILNKTAGVISLYITENNIKDYIDRNIPIVSVFHTSATPYPTVIFDYLSYLNKIREMTNNYEKTVIFNIKQNFEIRVQKYWDIFPNYSIEQYFQTTEKYDYRPIPLQKDKNIKIKQIKKILDTLDYTPNCVVFINESLFSLGSSLFEQYDHIFGKAKIITHFSEYLNYTGKYKITKIDFSISETAKKATDLLIKIIKKEYITNYNIYIKPTVIEAKK